MEAFSQLLEQLYFTNSTKAKAALIKAFLVDTPDPDRGWAIAAIAGTLSFDFFKRNTIKQLMLDNIDEVLFSLSYDYVGELSETVAHLWPHKEPSSQPLPSLNEIVTQFKTSQKKCISSLLASLLSRMTPSQRWALIKLGTRGLRIGMSARALKVCLADYGQVDINEVEQVWHGVSPPYIELLAWLEGKADKPDVSQALTFHPVMLSHPLDMETFKPISWSDWQIENKYDGIRAQLVSNKRGKALFSRTGENISHSFPDLLETVQGNFRLDGELLVLRENEFAPFNDLQQRLNKKKPSFNSQLSAHNQ